MLICCPRLLIVYSVFLVSIIGCGPKSEDNDRVAGDIYPYYSESALHSICRESSEVFSGVMEGDAGRYTKIFVMPTRFRHFVAGFVNEFVSGLEKRGWVVMDSDTQAKTDDPLRDIYISTGILNPDIVAFYMVDFDDNDRLLRQWNTLSKQAFTKIFISEDLNNKYNLLAAKEFAQWSDAVFARYPEAFTKAIAPNHAKCFPLYHGASEHYFNASRFDDNKKAQALLSGNEMEDYYPLRFAASKLLTKHSNLLAQRKFPGYAINIDPTREAIDYAKDLASYKIGLTGAVMGPYTPAPALVAKHFEIAATGSIVMTDAFVAPLMAKLGFIENVHYLTATPDNLESVLSYWLKPENAVKLDKIAQAGYDLVKSRHRLEERVEQFDSISIKIHAQKKHDNKTYLFSKDPIDVVFVVHPKDKRTLDLAIDGIRKNGKNVRKIFTVSSEELTKNADWVNENIFPFSKNEIALEIFKGDKEQAEKYLKNKKSRIGWVYQQLLKLYAPFIVPGISSNVLVVDADTIFLKETEFMTADGGPLFNVASEYHKPYFEHAARLLPGFKKIYPNYSGVAHHMLFQKPILEDLFKKIESVHGTEPWRALCRTIDLKELPGSSLSEYEIYFNFALSQTSQAKIRFLKFESLESEPQKIEELLNKGNNYVSFHFRT